MGLIPKWVSNLSWSDFWGGVKSDAAKIPGIVGDTVQGVVKPILGGVRSALTPSIIWIAVIVIIGLILFKNYKKVLSA